MANEAQLNRLLQQGGAAWNQWRQETRPILERKLRGTNLSDTDLSRAYERAEEYLPGNLGTKRNGADLETILLAASYHYEQ